MAKTHLIAFRVDTTLRDKITSAAQARGLSLSTFAKAALEAAADQPFEPVRSGLSTAAIKARARHAVIDLFPIICTEAAEGGARSYADAGKHIAKTLDASKTDELKQHLALGDEHVWLWFKKNYPKYFPKKKPAVPTRRRKQFIDGIKEAMNNGGPSPVL